MIKRTYSSIGFLIMVLLLNFACKNQSDFGAPLFKKFHNKVFKSLHQETYSLVFDKTVSDNKAEINNIDFIAHYYAKRQNELVFVLKL